MFYKTTFIAPRPSSTKTRIKTSHKRTPRRIYSAPRPSSTKTRIKTPPQGLYYAYHMSSETILH